MTRQLASFVMATAVCGVMGSTTVRCAGEESVTKAVCVVQSTQGNKCRGTVIFQAQDDGSVKVTAHIMGLSPNQNHAIHIHQFGDTRDLSGKSAGGHYNPAGNPHGLPPAKNRHAGDLGNLRADGNGHASYTIVVRNITIDKNNSILGRAIVVHAKKDDGGQPTGNAGARIGFGVIGIANPKL